jgi:hypothetical protein
VTDSAFWNYAAKSILQILSSVMVSAMFLAADLNLPLAKVIAPGVAAVVFALLSISVGSESVNVGVRVETPT